MVKIVIVRKDGSLEEESLNETLSSIHKQAGYKTKRNFYDRSSWPWKGNYISLYAKDTGRANQENKYELPPPVDSDLYFNNMVLVKHSDLTPCQEDLLDLTIEEWKECYNKLYGGFEDLGQEDSYSSEEDIPVELQTKHGYSKEGGFVVDSDDEDDEDWVPSGEEKPSEEEEEWIPSDEEGDEEEGQEGNEEEEEEEGDEEEGDEEEEYESEEPGSELSEDEYYSD